MADGKNRLSKPRQDDDAVGSTRAGSGWFWACVLLLIPVIELLFHVFGDRTEGPGLGNTWFFLSVGFFGLALGMMVFQIAKNRS
ncbi:MAG: hypothetical protein CMJ58_06130 [Planctomycetaceae bacterium]|nr:hypothetical protein [Planctomycetaceae bacterium]